MQKWTISNEVITDEVISDEVISELPTRRFHFVSILFK